MNNSYSFIKTKQSGLETITISDPDGSPFTISSENELFPKVLEACRAQDWAAALDLISVAKAIKTYSKGEFEVSGGQILVNGRQVPDGLAKYILEFKADNLDYRPLVRFAENLFENPSTHSVAQLFDFLTMNSQPITEDGCFIAYKRVGADFYDLHSHTMLNAPGTVVKMDRANVVNDPSQTCSAGLHVANWFYAAEQYGSGQGVMLMVKVNPKNTVSVPYDYKQAKMRVCEYEVLEVVSESLATRLTSSVGKNYVEPEQYSDSGFDSDE